MVVKKSNKQSGDGFHIALLRGINVGGKNILPMKDLVTIFSGAGCGDVRTYIQSGNVVFRATNVQTVFLERKRCLCRYVGITCSKRRIDDIKSIAPQLCAGA